MTSGTGRAEYKHVVPVDIDPGSKVNGPNGPFLAGNLAEVLEALGRFKAQLQRVAITVKRLRRQWFSRFYIHLCPAIFISQYQKCIKGS